MIEWSIILNRNFFLSNFRVLSYLYIFSNDVIEERAKNTLFLFLEKTAMMHNFRKKAITTRERVVYIQRVY